MAILKVKEGTEIYYKEWGKGQPVVFSHGWPLSADQSWWRLRSVGRIGWI